VKIGPIEVWPPVVLAPMAGITNAPFRALCREQGAGLFVCEMITTRALVERNPRTLRMVRFAESESPRSIQLYGVDPDTVGLAVKMIVEEDLADHIDLNFGCPVPKVTKRGGGSALPYKRNLLRRILRAAVANAGPLPVTMKMRKGIDEDHLTYLDAGRIAVEEGIAAIALHARTARQHYGGVADWDAIARLKEAVRDIPVLGNGDIWSADDALRMVAATGCDGVVVGRGCLGRPWLFKDLANAFDGSLRPRALRGDGLPQARRVVSQGVHGRLRAAPRAGHRRLARRAAGEPGRAGARPAVAAPHRHPARQVRRA
jgi:nifR3 family TIM-barrel protein